MIDLVKSHICRIHFHLMRRPPQNPMSRDLWCVSLGRYRVRLMQLDYGHVMLARSRCIFSVSWPKALTFCWYIWQGQNCQWWVLALQTTAVNHWLLKLWLSCRLSLWRQIAWPHQQHGQQKGRKTLSKNCKLPNTIQMTGCSLDCAGTHKDSLPHLNRKGTSLVNLWVSSSRSRRSWDFQHLYSTCFKLLFHTISLHSEDLPLSFLGMMCRVSVS